MNFNNLKPRFPKPPIWPTIGLTILWGLASWIVFWILLALWKARNLS